MSKYQKKDGQTIQYINIAISQVMLSFLEKYAQIQIDMMEFRKEPHLYFSVKDAIREIINIAMENGTHSNVDIYRDLTKEKK